MSTARGIGLSVNFFATRIMRGTLQLGSQSITTFSGENYFHQIHHIQFCCRRTLIVSTTLYGQAHKGKWGFPQVEVLQIWMFQIFSTPAPVQMKNFGNWGKFSSCPEMFNSRMAPFHMRRGGGVGRHVRSTSQLTLKRKGPGAPL